MSLLPEEMDLEPSPSVFTYCKITHFRKGRNSRKKNNTSSYLNFTVLAVRLVPKTGVKLKERHVFKLQSLASFFTVNNFVVQLTVT